MRYQARRPQVGDPTGDLAQLRELIAQARVTMALTDDPVRRYQLREAVLDAEAALLARQAAPHSGRLAELDEAFTAMGYRDGSRD